ARAAEPDRLLGTRPLPGRRLPLCGGLTEVLGQVRQPHTLEPSDLSIGRDGGAQRSVTGQTERSNIHTRSTSQTIDNALRPQNYAGPVGQFAEYQPRGRRAGTPADALVAVGVRAATTADIDAIARVQE